VREYPRCRRDRIAPEHSALPAYGGNGRVAALRREEVALLAGVSVALKLLVSWMATLDQRSSDLSAAVFRRA
jgi:hypothetical protein